MGAFSSFEACLRALHAYVEKEHPGASWAEHKIEEVSYRPNIYEYEIFLGPNSKLLAIERWDLDGSALEALAECAE